MKARILVPIVLLGLGLAIILKAQENKTWEKDYQIRVGVEEVRVDAVVMDSKGRQITDLTADDFEIYQDNKLQKISSSTYINDYQPASAKPTAAPRDSKTVLTTPTLTREDVRRTIVFVVDNLVMDFTEMHRARLGLRKFVENQMQPGDLVAIMSTAGGNAALQSFSSDKRHLLSLIDNLRWFIDVRTTRRAS